VGCGCWRAGWGERGVFGTEGGKEQESTDSYIEYVQFVGCGCWRAGWGERGVFGTEGGRNRRLLIVT